MEQHLDSGKAYNDAKELLAFELTKLVHGEEEAQKQLDAAKAIFAGSGNSDSMPTTTISADELTDGKIGLLTLLVKMGIAQSVSEARRLVQQGGITVNDEKATDVKAQIAMDGEVIVKKGKKVFHKAVLK